MTKEIEIRFYSQDHVCVPERSQAAFYGIERVTRSTIEDGVKYIQKIDRYGWLTSNSAFRAKFENKWAMNEWIRANVGSSPE